MTGMMFAACGQASPSQPERTLSLALITSMAGVPFSEMIRKGAEGEARQQQHLSLLFQAPAHDDAQEQVRFLDALIARRVDALLIAPNDSQVLLEPLRQAHQTGIAILTIDTFVGDGDYAHGMVTFPLTLISSDHFEGGQLAGKRLLQVLGGRGTVAIQSGPVQNVSEQQRIAGFQAALATTNGAVHVVQISHDDGTMDTARGQTTALLNRYPDLSAIFGTNAISSQGAVMALEQAHRHQVRMVFFDATQEGIRALRRGSATMVIAQDPRGMGRLAVQSAIDVLRHHHHLSKRITTSTRIITPETVETAEAQAAIYTI